MKKYNFFKQDALRPTEEQRLRTKVFYQNAGEIYARYDDWKDIDKFYFIPLYLEMTYSCGWVAEMAPDPVWLGSFVHCTLEHPNLFQYHCPACGKVVHPYRYVGSPLSGVVHLEGRCDCGWHGVEEVSGWRKRSEILRSIQEADKQRYWRTKLLHLGFLSSSVEELLNWLGRKAL